MPTPETSPGGYTGGSSSRPRIPIDPTLSLSGVIATLVAAAAAVSAWVSVQKQITEQEADLRALKELVIITNQTTQASLARIERSMDGIQARALDDRRTTK